MHRAVTAGGAWLLVLLAGCTSDGHFTLLGYTTAPTYDPNIRTVYVPIFGNRTYRRGVEFEITKAVIREIEAKTPYKVTSDRATADTELIGTVVSRRKAIINTAQTGEIREQEVSLGVEVEWKDLRSGDILSLPKAQKNGLDPTKPPPAPVLLLPAGTYIPELGGSTASAEAQAVRRLALQIVHLMETWNCPH